MVTLINWAWGYSNCSSLIQTLNFQYFTNGIETGFFCKRQKNVRAINLFYYLPSFSSWQILGPSAKIDILWRLTVSKNISLLSSIFMKLMLNVSLFSFFWLSPILYPVLFLVVSTTHSLFIFARFLMVEHVLTE